VKRDSVEDEGDKMSSGRSVIKVFLVNGESRSVRLDERMEVTDVVCSVLHRLRVNMEVAPQLFSIFLRHRDEGESYWLQPGFTVAEQLASYTARKPLDQWRFMLRMRVLPRTPQHLLTQDPVTFQYFYDQVPAPLIFLSVAKLFPMYWHSIHVCN
jgi:hypothetical protein